MFEEKTETAPGPDTEERTAGAGDNSGAALAELIVGVKRTLASAKGDAYHALQGFRDIGDNLKEAKELLGKGDFGEWCQVNFGFSKEWRARLMKLAKYWPDFLNAKDWAEGQGRILGRKEFSVDGALSLLAEHKRHLEAEEKKANGETDGGEGGEGEGAGPTKAKKETESEKLRRLLAEALAKVAELEAENATLKGAAGRAKAKTDKADARANGEANGTVDGATKARAKKVHGLWARGATDGEKEAAKARLIEMASKFAMSLNDFLASCGLSTP